MTQSEATAKEQYTKLSVEIDVLTEQLSQLIGRHEPITRQICGPDWDDVDDMSRVKESLKWTINHMEYAQLYFDDDENDKLEPEAT